MVDDNQTGTLDNFAIEDIPTKMLLVDPSTSDREINLIVYHSGNIIFFEIIFYRGTICSS